MKELFKGIYAGKTVLITGHTGFKGSWLAYWLSLMGARVVGYSLNIPTKPNHFKLLKPNITDIEGDILDLQKLELTINEYKPEIVFHLAAQALVRDSYINPIETFNSNVLGTANVLEACRKNKQVRAIINVTSDKCYQNTGLERGYHENDPMGGNDPYSASKGCAELVGNSYRSSFFNPSEFKKTHFTLLGDVRAGNVIGGGDWAKDRLIPDIIRAASESRSVKIRSPHAIRPWQHVLEPISGYLHLGSKLLEENIQFSDNWNFGPTEELTLTVGEVIPHLQKHWNKIKFEIEINKNNFHEAHILKLDSSKARKILKWQNVWNAEETFDRTINWYKNFYELNGKISTEIDLIKYIEDAKKLSLDWTK